MRVRGRHERGVQAMRGVAFCPGDATIGKAQMEHFLRAWPQVAAQRIKDQPLVVLTDYDGTLTPIARTPEQAVLSSGTRSIVQRLSRLPGVWLGVVSGRSLQEIRRLVRVTRMVYVGNHGLELAGHGVSFVHPQAQASRAMLRRLAVRLKRALRGIPGARMEWKGLTISAHWRNVPRSAQGAFHRQMRRLTAADAQEAAIRLTYGKRVVEIRPPVDWDKGKAVEWVLSRLCGSDDARRGVPIYLGDDQTDEEAFQAVNRLGGVSVRVGRPSRRTAATYRLSHPREVYGWLVELGEFLTVRRRGTHDRATGRS